MTGQKKKTVSVTLTEPYLKGIETLLSKGVYYNGSELLKDALRMLFEHHGINVMNEGEVLEDEVLPGLTPPSRPV